MLSLLTKTDPKFKSLSTALNSSIFSKFPCKRNTFNRNNPLVVLP